jgi:hypothetical protein
MPMPKINFNYSKTIEKAHGGKVGAPPPKQKPLPGSPAVTPPPQQAFKRPDNLAPVMNTEPDKAKYDTLRSGAAGAVDSNAQTQKDAMERRFAQMGGGPAGVQEKQDQLLTDDAALQKNAAIQGVNILEQGERERLQQIAEEREYARGERLSGQEFASQERIASQQFGTGERTAGQQFATSERLSGERNAKQMQANELRMQKEALAWEKDIGMQTLKEDKRINDFNMKMAEDAANKKDVFGRMGDFSTGVWSKITGSGYGAPTSFAGDDFFSGGESFASGGGGIKIS